MAGRGRWRGGGGKIPIFIIGINTNPSAPGYATTDPQLISALTFTSVEFFFFFFIYN